jgi:hypothetical protein
LTDWWSTHQYRRRAVTQIEGFAGWTKIVGLVERAQSREYFGRRDGALLATLFLTGGRVSEVVRSSFPTESGELVEYGLKKSNFRVDGDFVVVERMRVLKQYSTLDTWFDRETGMKVHRTDRSLVFRNFAFPKDEPLVYVLTGWLETLGPDDYLFPLSSRHAYRIVVQTDRGVWPHWFRSQRASQLAMEYGFGLNQLMRFFLWMDLATAQRYARLSVQDLMHSFPKGVPRMW